MYTTLHLYRIVLQNVRIEDIICLRIIEIRVCVRVHVCLHAKCIVCLQYMYGHQNLIKSYKNIT